MVLRNKRAERVNRMSQSAGKAGAYGKFTKDQDSGTGSTNPFSASASVASLFAPGSRCAAPCIICASCS